MRAEMADAMASYPYPAALLRKLRPPPVVQKSTTQPINGHTACGPSETNGAAHHAAVLPFAPGRVRGGGR
jgi:hypothetical protein